MEIPNNDKRRKRSTAYALYALWGVLFLIIAIAFAYLIKHVIG